MLKNLIPSSIRALMPSAKSVAGALASGALMEVGSSLVKNVDVKEDVGGLFNRAKDIGLELLGQAPLPGELPLGGTPEAAEPEAPASTSRKVPLAPRPARPAQIVVSGTPEHAQIPGVTTVAPATATSAGPPAAATAATAAAAAAASVVPPVGNAVRTMCTCAIHSGSPVLAGSGERIEFKQCDACKDKALKTAKYNLGMVLGWADAWKSATGIDPAALGDSCTTRPDPNASTYHTSFGFNDRQFNADLAGWQDCAATAANAKAKAKMLGKAGEPAAPAAAHVTPAAAPAAPAAAPVTPTRAAALTVSQQARRADKKLDVLKSEMEKATDPAHKTALQREADLAAEKKHHAEAVASHLHAEPATDEHRVSQEKIVAAIHEHVEKGPEVMESMLSAFYAMLPGAAPFEAPPWGSPGSSVAVREVTEAFSLDDGEPMDFPMSDDGSGDLASLPELSVQGAPAPAAPAPAAPVASAAPAAPSIDGAQELASPASPPLGFSMEPSEFAVDDSLVEGLGDDERDLIVGFAKSGYSDEEVREYATMFRAAAGNQHENPGTCDSGCSVRRA